MSRKQKQYNIGVDIGATKMNAVLFNGEKVIGDFLLATPKDTLDHLLVMIKALIEPLEEQAKKEKVKIAGIGAGIAGVLDSSREKVLNSPNLTIINNVNMAAKIGEMIGLPVLMDNDVNCFIRAEAIMGAGKKLQNIYGLTIGSGIGGGWWMNNDIYRGVHGGGGEPGNLTIDYENNITLEQAYHKLTQYNPAQIAEEAYRGDVLAEKVYEEFGAILGKTLANIVDLVDPEAIILGGGVVESSDLFISRTKKIMREHICSDEAKKKLKVLKSRLGKHAGAIGAALLVDKK